MKIGAHVSSAGGLSNPIDRGAEIGAETVQLFCSSPQGWAFKSSPEDQVIMAHPAFRDVQFLLEVPGTNKKGPGRVQLDRVKDIRARVGSG